METPLSWEIRLDIILNSARGLAYLHDHASPPIIHGDIKSANILLNQKLVAKVADFGLSKPTSDEGEKIIYSDEIRGTRVSIAYAFIWIFWDQAVRSHPDKALF